MGKIKYKEECSISQILNKQGLNIPEYQRPYKWERKHIRNLFYDIREAICKNISVYRMGSIILHRKNKSSYDIVDGQQRLISISLFMLYMGFDSLPIGAKNLLEQEYIGVSQLSAKENYSEWVSLCNLITEEELVQFYKYINNRCKVSMIEMPADSLPEAFQLFDSQNNRGKKLDPHDLLKAYHLRAIGDSANENNVIAWERYNDIPNEINSLNLFKLFDKHLFRMRRWSNGETGLTKRKTSNTRFLTFNESHIDDFKGVELGVLSYPYLRLYEVLHSKNIEFPNSLCMPIINGEPFFKYVEYSYELINNLFYKENIAKNHLSEDDYSYVVNKASKYSRNINLFNNLIALFVDRFGTESLNKEICEKIFIWAFYPRVVAKAIGDSMQANYAAGGKLMKRPAQKLFHVLASSSSPNYFISRLDMDLLQNYTSKDIIYKLSESEVK